MLIEKITTRYLLVEINQKLRTEKSGPLSCWQKNEEKVWYGTCPEGMNKSCYFALDYLGRIDPKCSNADWDINTCYVKQDTYPYVVCWCNDDNCNSYCSWFDCKPYKIQLNSTNVDFPEVMNSTLKEFDEVCTAKCWPNVYED